MPQAAIASAVLGAGLIVAFFIRSVLSPFYRLPVFAAQILATQPHPPRVLRLRAVGLAILSGLDGATYATGAVFPTLLGLYLLLNKTGIGRPIALISIAAGLFCEVLLVYRVVQMWRALQTGDAQVVDVAQAKLGRARLYGAPWGDMANGSAVRGAYTDPGSRAERSFYVQEQWAKRLTAGMQMWVVRLNGRDVLYAPVDRPPLRPAAPATSP